MMNTYLQESFNYCPGKRYVVTGHFELVDPRGDFIKKIEWANTVAPEMEITMIMTTTIVRKSGTYCQRCLAAINMRSVSYSEGNLSWACQSCGQHNSYHSPGRLKEPQIVEITDDIDANANVEAVAYDSSEPDSKNPIVDIYESWEYTLFKPVFIMVSDHWAMFIFDNVWSQTEMNIHRCE
jgi:hypothetical protein